jgi:O-methyltransferase
MLRQLLARTRSPRPVLSPIARRVKDARLTYLSEPKLAALESALASVLKADVPGDVVECGIALGGSAIVLATGVPDTRQFHGYDLFGLIPPPESEHDDAKSKARYEEIRSGRSPGIGGDMYYGYMDDLYERVVASFARFGLNVDGDHIALHRGRFESTLHPPHAIALAHIDCDWYDPVKLCLQRIVPKLSIGGYVVLDDYNDYGGCRRATDEFMESNRAFEILAHAPNFVFRRVH